MSDRLEVCVFMRYVLVKGMTTDWKEMDYRCALDQLQRGLLYLSEKRKQMMTCIRSGLQESQPQG